MDTLPLASQNGPVPPPGAVASRTPHELRFARSCYDHLAGALAVALHDRLIRDDEGQLRLAPGAAEALGLLGVDPQEARPAGAGRPRLRNCLDWSERRPHLAGATGAALLSEMLDRRWVTRRSTPRALRLTRDGREALTGVFGRIPAGSPPPSRPASAADPLRLIHPQPGPAPGRHRPSADGRAARRDGYDRLPIRAFPQPSAK